MAEDLKNICRICLCEEGEMLDIFAPTPAYSYQTSLNNKIMLCCQIEVSPDDDLPKQICQKCNVELNIAFNLRELSQKSNATLRKYYQITQAFFSKLKENESLETEGISIPLREECVVDVRNVAPESNIVSVKQKWECGQCGKQFVFKCHLADHQQSVHSNYKRFLCSICGKVFSQHTVLLSHVKTHGERKFRCDLCALTFHRSAHLTAHMRTHTNEKPFVCQHCGRSFAQSGYLKEHVRVHSGEKPFVCETCGHGFARKSALVQHRRVHTGELPFPCPHCTRAFSQRSQRKRHVVRHHNHLNHKPLKLHEHDQIRAMLSKIQ